MTSVFVLILCAIETVSVFCIGDSITAGGYPTVLGKGSSFEVSSYGVNGSMSKPLYERLERELGADGGPPPDYVVWYAGVNDCMGGQRGKRAFYWTGKAVTLISGRGSKAVVVKHHPWAAYTECDKACQRCSVGYNSEVDRQASEGDFIVVDTSLLGNKGKLNSEYDCGDGLHLSSRGNSALAKLVSEAIRKDLRR